MNCTVFLKDTLGEGKMTLEIHNISVFDQCHCLFKEHNTREEATMVLRVGTEGNPLQVSLVMPLWTHDPEFMNAGS